MRGIGPPEGSRPAAVRGMPQTAHQPKVEVVAGRSARRPLDNYADYDTPSFRRRPRVVGDDVRGDVNDESYLDIPAFLRRQAD